MEFSPEASGWILEFGPEASGWNLEFGILIFFIGILKMNYQLYFKINRALNGVPAVK